MAQGKTTNTIVKDPGGRSILVINRPIAGGRHWIGTHEDITERLMAEQQRQSLIEQEGRRAAVDAAILSFRESVESELADGHRQRRGDADDRHDPRAIIRR